MESCWETGGPDWLFGVVLIAAFVGVAGFLMWLPVPEGEPTTHPESPSRLPKPLQRLLQWILPVGLVSLIAMNVIAGDFGWGDVAWGLAPIVAITTIAFVADRAPRLARWFLLTVWVGGAAAAVGAIVAMFYLGHPC